MVLSQVWPLVLVVFEVKVYMQSVCCWPRVIDASGEPNPGEILWHRTVRPGVGSRSMVSITLTPPPAGIRTSGALNWTWPSACWETATEAANSAAPKRAIETSEAKTLTTFIITRGGGGHQRYFHTAHYISALPEFATLISGGFNNLQECLSFQ